MADDENAAGAREATTDCEGEPIHMPGTIQPHGALLVLGGPDLVVRRASCNSAEFLGIPPEALLGRPLDGLLGPSQTAQLWMVASDPQPSRFNAVKLSLPDVVATRPFDALFHRVNGELVVELEPTADADGEFGAYYRTVQRATVRLQSAGDVADLCEVAAEEVRRVTGFDRAMVYRFDAEWNGEVVAESHADDLPPTYLGLHFPASDIPAQARRLYETTLIRAIPDARYVPVGVVGLDDPAIGSQLDMSGCVLRSVSPMHLEYLRNMGVAATLTISILRDGRLWGLIACHHRRPRAIPFDRRVTCEFFGQVIAAQVAIREDGEERAYRLGASALRPRLLEQMARSTPSVWGLIQARPGLLDLIDAGGAAVVREGECRTVGVSPGEPAILEIAEWLAREEAGVVFATDALPDRCPVVGASAEAPAGLLALELSRERRSYLMWFRPGRERVVHWAGDPNKPMLPGDPTGPARLHPRRSFDLWKQTVRGRSEPWKPREVAAAAELRGAVLGVLASEEQLQDRARRQAAVAELGQKALACDELDALYRDAVSLVASTLGVAACRLFKDRRGGPLDLVAGAGAQAGPPHPAGMQASGDRLAEYAMACGSPVVADDLDDEIRFDAVELREAHGYSAAMAAPLAQDDRRIGVLAAYSDRPRRFHAEEVHFLVVVANLLATAVRRRKAEQALEHQSRHDGLTGLPNRNLLMELLRRSIADGGADRTPVALMLIDLDRFKEVNDTYGHHYGDELLRQSARRFRDAIRGEGTVARLGGDEFAVLLPGAGRQAAGRVAAAILGELARPFAMEGGELCEVGGSIGIALHPDHGGDGLTLMRRADVAMYAAKRSGGGSTFYTPELDDTLLSRATLIAQLRRAVEEGDGLDLAFQPKFDLRSRRFFGVEALIRWRHPAHNLLLPDRFITLAEETGLITSLDRWVLRQAASQRRRWLARGVDLDIALNVSPHSLLEGDLAGDVAGLVRELGLMPAGLTIEVTEGALMRDPERAAEVLRRLRDESGIRVAIDDFGTGYSSLAYLKRLPVDEVKIDRVFVKDMVAEPRDASIVRTIIELGHNLGLAVVAEGVEHAEALDRLSAMGCDQAQGFHLGRPSPASMLVELVEGAGGAAGTSPEPAMAARPGPARVG
ncbi:Phytochrome-like protein cph1 [Aquisphaera giovannonii]|uniref:Phytochrome-like protein cph1 n=1 Tax=Aquisphaera giovannonii TaxID=406548 RepID=A0A5B9WAC4_9BACT|nr:EAL domain-containing protein [Aquisphaera giovannonii]QEH37045.1 Phytochrome-like protein cph1 [Aquisphaera giovannonii]